MKVNLKIMIGIVIAVLISITSSYVLAETLINSKDVVYEDNSNLVADNVQDAIDGTCSKIDTRLKGIEDELYTVKPITGRTRFTTTSNFSYTGLSVTFPANSYCTITIGNGWSSKQPRGLILAGSKDTTSHTLAESTLNENAIIYTIYSGYFESETTYYVWTKHALIGETDEVAYNGWCATKYK